MSSEAALWSKVRAELGPWGRLVRVENTVDLGTPDVAFAIRVGVDGPRTSGWIELKEVDGWPAKMETRFVLAKFTREQRDFLVDWERAGGVARLLVQVGRDYVLLDSGGAAEVFARALTQRGVWSRAIARGRGRFPTGDVMRGLLR